MKIEIRKVEYANYEEYMHEREKILKKARSMINKGKSIIFVMSLGKSDILWKLAKEYRATYIDITTSIFLKEEIETQPKYLIFDEIDRLDNKSLNLLAYYIDNGGIVIASALSIDNIPKYIIRRFEIIKW